MATINGMYGIDVDEQKIMEAILSLREKKLEKLPKAIIMDTPEVIIKENI